jgi:hypothetical protein
MAVSTTLLRQRRVLAAQLEAVVGTAETLTADDALFNVFDPVIQPNINFIERPGAAGRVGVRRAALAEGRLGSFAHPALPNKEVEPER